MSNAHIFREDWIKRLYPQPGRGGYRHQRRGHTPGSEPQVEWPSRGPDLKVKAVCRACNSGWMNELDHAAESVFATQAAMGLPVKLVATADKTKVARWCSLIAILFDRASDVVRLGPSTYKALYAGEVPHGTMIWLGSRLPEPGWGTLAFGSTKQLLLVGDVLAPVQRNREQGSAYFVTFGVGHLFVQALMPTPDTQAGAQIERRVNPQVLRQLWPDSLLPFGWPPHLRIRASEMAAFMSAFHRDEA